MAIKPFEIQSPSLVLAGVQMQAGATGVVIPGVTQATSYSVEEVEDTGDQSLAFGTVPTVIDNGYFTILNGGSEPAGYVASVYTVEELDGNNYITEIQVDTAGSFPSSYASTVQQSMWATEVADPFTSFNPADWNQIPFQPVVRAGEIENVSGGGLTTYAQYNQYTCEYTDGNQIFMPGDQTAFLSTDYYVRFVNDLPFVFYQITDFQYDGGSNYTSITLDGTPGTKNNVVFWTYLYVQNASTIIPGDNITFTSLEGAVILDAATGGGNTTLTPTSDGTFSTLPDFLDFVAYTSLKTGQTSEGVFFSGNAQTGFGGTISYPVRTDFSINGTTKVVVTVDMVMNDNCSDFGLCVFENGTEPQWFWGPNTTRLSAQYDCEVPQLNSFTDQIQSSYNLPGPGTYRVRFTYDPNNSPNLTLETLDTNNTLLDTLTLDGTLNTNNNYCIGFAADQDSTELRTYINNLSIAIDGGATYSDTLQSSPSQLTNGNNSFVLDGDGNVVFQGPASGLGVDRGLVWDYGVSEGGVNSQVRQDEMGLTVRAYTNGGGGANGYSAPVNIVTNQNATQQTWTFDGQGNITFPDGSIQSTAYVTPVVTGFFDRMNQTSNPTNTVNGEATLVDTGGNTYVSYSYYDNNLSINYGGIIKYNLDGVKQWSRNIFSPNGDADYLKIVSLEQATFSGGSFVQATGYYYDNVQSKNIGFSYLIDPDGGTGTPLDTEVSGDNTLILNDAVGGIDYNNNDFTVIAGTVSNEVLTKTLTPISPSGVNKLYITWTDFNNNNLVTGDRLVVSNFGGYGWGDINTIYAIASPDGTIGDGTYINLQITYNDAGTYSIINCNGWGGDPSLWTTPIALKVLGSNLGGADTTNDLTFDFNPTVFNNDGNNIHLAVSNIAGTSISDVFTTFYNDYDFGQAGVIDTPTDFQYNLNEQAFIGRLGVTAAWSKKFGTTNNESLNSVAVDNNGYIYAAGYAWNGTKGGLVVKYDINGSEQWAKYIDPDTNTGIRVYSIDLTYDGQIICVSDDAIVTQLNSTDGQIMWQKQISTSISWDSNPKGTATPDGNYIFTNYEDNNYTLYVVCVSCVDGSEVWSKRIAINYNGNGGDLWVQSDYRAQNIDCNSDKVSIAASIYYWDGSQDVYSGLVINMPIDGNLPDDTYDNTYVVTSPILMWTTLTTTVESATLTYQSVVETAGPSSPTGNNSLITATNTIVGGGPVSLTNGTSNVAILSPSGNISMAVNGGNVAYITEGSISIGKNAGYNSNVNQGNNAIAIGWHSGDGESTGQGANSIAIGADDVGWDQGDNSIAIGYQAGWGDTSGIGANSVVIGAFAGYAYASTNSIILNASGTDLNSDNQGFYVNPVREDTGVLDYTVHYNTSTKEVTYASAGLLGNGLQTSSSNIITTIGLTGFVNFDNGSSNMVVGTNGSTNVYITANSGGTTKSWGFGTDGNLTVPGPIVGPSGGVLTLKGSASGPTGQFATSTGATYGYGGALAIFAASDFTSGSVTSVQVGNVVVEGNGSTANVITVNPGIAGPGTYGITIDKSWNQVPPFTWYAGYGADNSVKLQSGTSNLVFDSSGNLTLPTNSFTVNYANGTQVSLAGTYGNSNVVSLLGNLGSNTIVATGSISGGDLNAGGNLDVDGNGSIGGNLTIVGNINFSGGGSINQITSPFGYFTGNSDGSNALYAGVPGGTIVPNAVAQFTGDANAYMQVNMQNKNHGTQASIEYVITGDLGTDTTDYLDIGFSSSTWDGSQDNSLGTAVGARDGWMYVQGGGGGGNLVLGTTTSGKKIKFNAGGPNSANTVATIDSTGFTATGNVSAAHLRGEGGNISNVQVGNISGLGNIATINIDGSSSNVLYGNGVFAPSGSGGTYGNSNVATFLASYGSNTITTTGNVSVGNIIATNIGNISAVNLTGSTSNVLYGNGVFAAPSAVSAISNGTSNVNISTSGGNVQIVSAGNSVANITGTGANIAGTLSVSGNANVGNLGVSGLITATGGITGGFLNTGGNISGSNLTINPIGTGQQSIIIGNGYSNTLAVQTIDISPNLAGSVGSTIRILPSPGGTGQPSLYMLNGATGGAVNFQLVNNHNTANGANIYIGQATVNGNMTITLGTNFSSTSTKDLNLGIGNGFNGNSTGGNGNMRLNLGGQLVGANARGNITIGSQMGGDTAIMNIGIGDSSTAAAGNAIMNIGIGNNQGGANGVTNIGIANNITSGNSTKSYQVDIGSGSTKPGVINIGNANTTMALAGTISVTGNVTQTGSITLNGATPNLSAGNVQASLILRSGGNIQMYGGPNIYLLASANGGIRANSLSSNSTSYFSLFDDALPANNTRTIYFASSANSDATSSTTINVGQSVAPTQLTISATTSHYGNFTVFSGNISTTGNVTSGNIITNGLLSRGTTAVSNNAWTTNGIALKIPTATYTDNSTAAGTQTSSYVSALNAPALAFSNAVTVTNATTLFVAAPTAGTNATITNSYAMIANGNVQVNGNAGVITPNKPAFRVTGSSSSNIGPNQTIASAQGATVDYNQGNYYDNTTGTFTAPVAGLYQINISGRNASNSSSYSQLVAVKNLAGTSSVQCMLEFGASSSMDHAGVGTVAKLAVNDTLNLRVLVGTIQFDANDNWTVTFLG